MISEELISRELILWHQIVRWQVRWSTTEVSASTSWEPQWNRSMENYSCQRKEEWCIHCLVKCFFPGCEMASSAILMHRWLLSGKCLTTFNNLLSYLLPGWLTQHFICKESKYRCWRNEQPCIHFLVKCFFPGCEMTFSAFLMCKMASFREVPLHIQ